MVNELACELLLILCVNILLLLRWTGGESLPLSLLANALRWAPLVIAFRALYNLNYEAEPLSIENQEAKIIQAILLWFVTGTISLVLERPSKFEANAWHRIKARLKLVRHSRNT